MLTFVFADADVPWEVHVFYATAWSGEPTESDEMAPAWFDVAALPFDRMWADDRVWCALGVLPAGRARGEAGSEGPTRGSRAPRL